MFLNQNPPSRRSLLVSVMLLAAASLIALGTSPVTAGKPGGGGSPPPTSVIYFTFNQAIWQMYETGSGKLQTFPQGVAGTPSSRVYGGSRWWLTFGTDPVTGKNEIFAFQENGDSVQLTATDLDGISWNCYAQDLPRWSNDGQDTFVTVHGVADREGIEGAYLFRLPIIGDIDAMLDLNLLPLTVADCEEILPPHLPRPDISYWQYVPRPYCWSNQSWMLTYTEYETLKVRVLSEESAPVDVNIFADTNGQKRVLNPSWAPDGSRIAFTTQNSSAWGGAWTINPSGTGTKQVVKNSGTMTYFNTNWSPDSQQLLLHTIKSKLGDTTRQIARMPAGGGSQTILTNDLPDGPEKWPIAWLPLSP